MSLAPVLIFVYNRPGHTRNMVESLLANTLAGQSSVYIYSDGPREAAHEPGVTAVREYIHTLTGFKRIEIIERKKNYGLAASIIDGVTTQVKAHGKVIVLEDDLLLAPHLLEFVNEALEVYKEETRVGNIHCCEFTGNPGLPYTFLSRWVGCWGWATWERAWNLFNPDAAELLSEVEQKGLSKSFDFDGNYHFTRMLRNQAEGKLNSWAIRWYASLFLSGTLSLNAGRSLVINDGFDDSGTHCGKDNPLHFNLWKERLPVEKILPPREDRKARSIYAAYYYQNYNFWAKVRRRLKRTLRGDFGR